MARHLNRYCKNCLATKHFIPGEESDEIKKYYCETCNGLLEELSGQALANYRKEHPPITEPPRPKPGRTDGPIVPRTAAERTVPHPATTPPPPSSAPPQPPTQAAPKTQSTGGGTGSGTTSAPQQGPANAPPQQRVQPGRRPSGLIIP
jgi:hypothetical protein